MGRLRSSLKGHKVYFDSNIFMYYIEEAENFKTLLFDVLEGLESHEFFAVTSQLTLSECLVQPIAKQRNDLARLYYLALESSDCLTVSAISLQVLISAATVRAQINLKLPDAIHAATALTQHCTALLTNDAGFSRVPGIELFILSDWLASPC